MKATSTERCPGCFQVKGAANPCPHCGFDETAPRPVQALPLRTRLNNQFIVGRVLGKPGGFGITYLGWDQMLETSVAIKEYLPRELAVRAQDSRTLHPHSTDEAELFRYGLEQFLAEARTLAKLDHPNIVRVRHFFEANGTAYLVMDYYRGSSLQEHLDSLPGSRLPEADALALMQPILDGLRAVHAKGFLHRDIKPQNIYLAQTDSGGVRPILLDFGAARQAMGDRSRSLSVVISPGYAPFEQYHRKGQQGPATDIYGAAAVLYRMLTGVTPPEATERMAGDELRPAAEFGIRAPISAALTQALAMKVDERPASVAAFQQGLQASTVPSPARPGHEQSPTEPSQTGSAVPPATRRLSLVGVGVLIGVLVGALIAITLLSQPVSPPQPAPVSLSPRPEPEAHPASESTALPKDQPEALEPPKTPSAPKDTSPEVAEIESEIPPADDPPRDAPRIEPELPAVEESEVLVDTDTKPTLPVETEPDEVGESEPSSPEVEVESVAETESAPPSPSNAVDTELLATCREHMENMRYTNPEDDNALLCYQAVQRQDPENLEAQQAIEKMTAFYLESGQRDLREGNYVRLRDRVERLRKIDPNSPNAKQLEQAIAAAKEESASLLGQRYRDNGDGTVTDLQTGLQWMRCSQGQSWTGATCDGSANEMTWTFVMPNGKQKNWAAFAGHQDWRLPTIDELKTIVHCSIGQPFYQFGSWGCHNDSKYPAIYSDAFPNTPSNWFWSASENNSCSGCYAWGVDFYDGGYGGLGIRNRHARLVRGGK